MSSPIVSIIIPIYKVEPFILRCLESVSLQRYQNFECLLVDDASPDDSMTLAEAYVRHQADNRFRLFYHKENRGLSDSRNTGVKNALGKYIYFLDSDDELPPDAIAALVAAAEKTNAEITLGKVSCINEEENWVRDYFPIRVPSAFLEGNENIFKAFIQDDYPGMSCNKLVRRDFLIENDIWFKSNLLSQDVLWSFHCAHHLSRMAFVDEVTYLYYFHKGSIIHNRGEKHFNDWMIIANEFAKAYHTEEDPTRKKFIKKYINQFIALTLELNWKGQKNEALWKKSYDAYLKLPRLDFKDLTDPFYSKKDKKNAVKFSLPTNLAFKFFLNRFEGKKIWELLYSK